MTKKDRDELIRDAQGKLRPGERRRYSYREPEHWPLEALLLFGLFWIVLGAALIRMLR